MTKQHDLWAVFPPITGHGGFHWKVLSIQTVVVFLWTAERKSQDDGAVSSQLLIRGRGKNGGRVDETGQG